jgi:hypothetical protein
MSKMLSRSILIISLAAGLASAAFAQPFTFTTIDFPGATPTLANGINASTQIVGLYAGGAFLGGPFLYSGGSFSPINVPGGGGIATEAFGINEIRQIVRSAPACVYSDGSFTIFEKIGLPGATPHGNQPLAPFHTIRGSRTLCETAGDSAGART